MVAPIPNLAKLIIEEENVTAPIRSSGGERADGAYDLRFFESLHEAGAGVLVVKMALEAEFVTGISTRPGSAGTALYWAPHEITEYLRKAEEALVSVWSNRYPIVAQGRIPPGFPGVVFVRYEVRLRAGEVAGRHWKLRIRKVDRHAESKTFRTLKTVRLDEMDVNARRRRGHDQRGIVHEFGHMQGLRDEYDGDIIGMPHLFDRASVMNNGETVRPRHYTHLAHWLTRMMRPLSFLRRLSGASDDVRYLVVDPTRQLLELSHAALE